MKRPLDDVRVVECGIYHAGPGGTAILGDLGAEVIKIEQPVTGDPSRENRQIGDLRLDLFPGKGSLFCEGANRNKKSVTVDLETRKGQKIVHRLVAKADVFLTNMRPQAVEEMEISYSVLRQINPELIYAKVSGFGPNGPDKDLGAFDYQGQARSGFMYALGEPDMPPLVCQFGVIDQVTSILASHQIITALYMRERTCIGQEVNVSLLGSAMSILYLNILFKNMVDLKVPRHDRIRSFPLRNYYKCKDNRWLMITLNPPMKHWPQLCKAIEKPELENDPRFNTEDKQHQNTGDLIKILDAIFINRPCEEWVGIFREYDLFCCGINTLEDLANDPQVIANNYLVDFDHPSLGKIKIPGYFGHFSECTAGTVRAAPDLGEDTQEILKTIGGYSKDEIHCFEKEGII